jgi:hypothetical protein
MARRNRRTRYSGRRAADCGWSNRGCAGGCGRGRRGRRNHRSSGWHGIPEYEAKRYEGRVKDGGILLSVHCDDRDWTLKAKQILQRTGAQDVASTAEASADWQKTDRPLPRAS